LGVSTNISLVVVTLEAALNVFQAFGSCVRFRFSSPAITWNAPPTSALTVRR